VSSQAYKYRILIFNQFTIITHCFSAELFVLAEQLAALLPADWANGVETEPTVKHFVPSQKLLPKLQIRELDELALI
jgi:hypothetical protein